MENVSTYIAGSSSFCCGCETCVSSCPLGCIRMELDGQGFFSPAVDEAACTHCGRCVSVCPRLKPPAPAKTRNRMLAGHARSEDLVKNSSSGGMFSLLAAAFLVEPNSYVAGVVFNGDCRSVRYAMASTVDELAPMRVSKYIQAHKGGIYGEIRRKLEGGARVLFTGCPCEAAGLVNFLGGPCERLFIADIVCQGPTSETAWNLFADTLEKRCGAAMDSVNMRYIRDKRDVWIPQWLYIHFANGREFLKKLYETEFGYALHTMQRLSCYTCGFAGHNRVSDLTLGDYHKADTRAPYYNRSGTSVLIVNTDRGEALVKTIRNAVLMEADAGEVTRHNPRIEGGWPDEKGHPTLDNARRYAALMQKNGLTAARRATQTRMQKIMHLMPYRIKQLIRRIRHR